MPAQDGPYPSDPGSSLPSWAPDCRGSLYNPARGERLMLHAHRLTFTNPLTLETIQVEALLRVLKKGWETKKEATGFF